MVVVRFIAWRRRRAFANTILVGEYVLQCLCAVGALWMRAIIINHFLLIHFSFSL